MSNVCFFVVIDCLFGQSGWCGGLSLHIVNHSLHFEQQGGGGDGAQHIGWQKCDGFGAIAWHGDNCEQIII